MDEIVEVSSSHIKCEHKFVPEKKFVLIDGFVLDYGYAVGVEQETGNQVCAKCGYIKGTKVYCFKSRLQEYGIEAKA